MHLKFPWKGRVDAVVGIGGTGSQILTGLARMDVSMRAMEHPGLEVTAIDPDVVTEFNVGRQLFSPSDIGQNKATVLCNRLNAFFGCAFRSCPERVRDVKKNFHLVIGCVDSRRSRRDIANHTRAEYWMDIGNAADFAQVVLGNLNAYRQVDGTPYLPNAAVLFPKIIDPKGDKNSRPSCSMAGALSRQDLFINQAAATFALNLLWRWYRNGIDFHGGFINLATGRTTPLPIDEDAWRNFGYYCGEGVMRKIVRWIKKPGNSFFRYGRARLECGHVVDTCARLRTRCKKCKPEKES